MQEWSRLHLALTVGDLCVCARVCVCVCVPEQMKRDVSQQRRRLGARGDGGLMEWQVVNVEGRVSVDTRGAVAVKGFPAVGRGAKLSLRSTN